MTGHLSPCDLHGLRLVTIGFGLASTGLLAVPAQAQPCAPAPFPTTSAAAPSGQTAAARTLGDPLLIVGPRIEVFRATPDPEPEQQGDNHRRWSLHPMAPFVRMEVMTINGDKSSCVARRLTGWDTLLFELRDDDDMAFEDFVVYRDAVPEGAASAVIVESRHRDLKFKRDDEDATTRIRANDDDLYISQIHYGDHFICVANSGQPEEGPCERKAMPPEKLLVRLCTNDTCTAMP